MAKPSPDRLRSAFHRDLKNLQKLSNLVISREMPREQTIRDSVSFEDIAVHSGKRVRAQFLPAPAGSGINFRRIDLPGSAEVKAIIDNVMPEESYRRTLLSSPSGVQVFTVEHLLAAIYGLEIDNLTIELDGEEVPFADGSALPYVEILLAAGLTTQEKERQELAIEQPLVYREEPDIAVSALPWEDFAITFFIDYPNRVVGKQALHLKITPEVFIKEIAPARTYLFLKDVAELKTQGLIKGGDLDRAVLISEDKILTPSLRFKDEIVRHKILDIIGDLALLGRKIKAHIIAKKSGHRAHLNFLKKLKGSLSNDRN